MYIKSTILGRQTYVHAAEPLVHKPSPFEVETTTGMLKRFKLPGSDQIAAELIQSVGEILRSEIHKVINFIWNQEKLPDQRNESIIVLVYKKASLLPGKKTPVPIG
jgi:hypothetical protein